MEYPKKAKIKETVTTTKGTLYSNELVTIQQAENGHYRVVNAMGKIFYVARTDVILIKK